MTIAPRIKVSFDGAKPTDWKARALAAEAILSALQLQLQLQLITINHSLDATEQHLRSRAALTNITREGRKLHFTFVRNGELHRVTAMGTWDDDVDQWKRDLLEPIAVEGKQDDRANG